MRLLVFFILGFTSFFENKKLDYTLHIEYSIAFSNEKRIYDFDKKSIRKTVIDENQKETIYHYKLKNNEIEMLNTMIKKLFDLKDCYSTEQSVIDGFITKVHISKSKIILKKIELNNVELSEVNFFRDYAINCFSLHNTINHNTPPK